MLSGTRQMCFFPANRGYKQTFTVMYSLTAHYRSNVTEIFFVILFKVHWENLLHGFGHGTKRSCAMCQNKNGSNMQIRNAFISVANQMLVKKQHTRMVIYKISDLMFIITAARLFHDIYV